jgi:hypothetical protein
LRFPWFKRKPKLNTDGGPPTALFSFDRDRERQMAEQYSGRRQDWIEARYQLIDEVLEYRRRGVLTPSLLEACDAEFAVAPWANSAGIRRLAQLAIDGHAVAAQRLDILSRSPDWKIRYEAFQTLLDGTDNAHRRDIARRALADRSAKIRTRLASDVAMAHLIDLADEIESAASRETKEGSAQAIYWAAWHLRKNQRTGNRNSFIESPDERDLFEADWARFRESCAFAKKAI